jgi:hypothetical protein
MRICYHPGNTAPGPFQAFLGSHGKRLLEKFPTPDSIRAIADNANGEGNRSTGPVVASAFLGLAAPRPVLFRPKAQHCEALEQVTPNFTIGQYSQPYPVCIVEFPFDYAINRLIPLAAEADHTKPLFAIVVKEKNLLALAVFGTKLKMSFECWSSANTTLDLRSDVEGVGCAALNFLMLVDDGEVIEGSIPAKKVKRKRRHMEKPKPPTPVFTLQDQSIKLFSTHEPDPAYVPPDEPHGTPKRPHWRKGHWRFYESGKRVRINPVLVNLHKLADAS